MKLFEEYRFRYRKYYDLGPRRAGRGDRSRKKGRIHGGIASSKPSDAGYWNIRIYIWSFNHFHFRSEVEERAFELLKSSEHWQCTREIAENDGNYIFAERDDVSISGYAISRAKLLSLFRAICINLLSREFVSEEET